MYDQLTGTEVNKSHEATDYLLNHAEHLRLEPILRVKLDSLRADLKAEQEDRRKIAQS